MVDTGIISGTTITGSIFEGTDFILDQNGLWFYSGTPGGAGTWTAEGSFIQSQGATFATHPAAVGDLLVMHVSTEGSAPPLSISGGNYTWAQLGSTYTGVTNAGFCSAVFVGTATATSAGTATISYSGTPSAFRNAGQPWRSSTGAYTLIDQEFLDSTGTNTMPAIKPTAAGQLYSVYEFDNSTSTPGTTPGYTYDIDADGNGLCFNGNCTIATQSPTFGDSTCAFGTAVMLTANSGSTGTLVMALVNPSGTGKDQFGTTAPIGINTQQAVNLGAASAPAGVAGIAALFSQLGTLAVVDGNDKNTYQTERNTRILTSNFNVTTTTLTDTGLHMPVAPRRYRASGVLYVIAPAANPGTIELNFAGPGGATGEFAWYMIRAAVLNGTAVAAPNSTFSIGPSPLVASNEYLLYVDGVMDFTQQGVVTVEAACAAAGTSWIVGANSYIDYMPF
jgi:hypothetical protein